QARVDKLAKSALLKSAARESIAGSSPAPGTWSRAVLNAFFIRAQQRACHRPLHRRFEIDTPTRPLVAWSTDPGGRTRVPAQEEVQEQDATVRNSTVIGRTAALAAVVIAVIAVAI